MTTESSTASDAPATATTPASASEAAPAPTGAEAGTTPANPPAPAAPDADPPKGEAAPVEYTLTLPDDSPLDAAAREKTVAFARDRGLSAEAAQGVAELLDAQVREREATLLAAYQKDGAKWHEQNEAWKAEALADADLGGGDEQQLAAKVAIADRVLAEFFPPTTIEFLQNTGLASHPDVVRGFVKLGRTLSEDGKLVLPGPTTSTTRRETEWFPSMTKKTDA